jgi:hypothetical protein
MRSQIISRADFINSVFTSRIPGEVATRFSFVDGEVGALYTLGRDPISGESRQVVLYIATFPPSSQHGGRHDFGIDYSEQPVATSAEAQQVLAQFGPEQAALFRASCRPH